MLSRVANLIYWTARYLERAENIARIVDVNAQLVLDSQNRQPDDPKLWEPLVYVSGNDALYKELYQEASERGVLEFMLFDKRNPSSFVSCIAMARENARCIRDQLSGEIWEQLNTFFLKLNTQGVDQFTEAGAADFLSWLKSEVQLFYGVADSMLPRTSMWWFFELGRFLERADNTSRIIDVKYFMLLPETTLVGSAVDMIQWASVLRSCSGFEAFRRSRHGRLNLEQVLDYLVRDEDFPRSILFSIEQARHALHCITRDSPHLQKNPADALLEKLLGELKAASASRMIEAGLHELLDAIQTKIADVHAAIQETFIHYPIESAKMLA